MTTPGIPMAISMCDQGTELLQPARLFAAPKSQAMRDQYGRNGALSGDTTFKGRPC
jgi:hypothetical protein